MKKLQCLIFIILISIPLHVLSVEEQDNTRKKAEPIHIKSGTIPAKPKSDKPTQPQVEKKSTESERKVVERIVISEPTEPDQYKLFVDAYNRCHSSTKCDANSQYTLGEIYHKGEVVPQDYGVAIKWLKAAKEQGHPMAMIKLNEIKAELENKIDTLKENIKQERRQAIEKIGQQFNQNINKSYENRERLTKCTDDAIKEYRDRMTEFRKPEYTQSQRDWARDIADKKLNEESKKCRNRYVDDYSK